MSLSASMWSSVSGLLAHGDRMSTIGNNISNVSTVAYKGSRMDFADMMYQSIGTGSGVGQVGCGTSVGIIMNDFSQGAFETSTRGTDVAISGNGFFKVTGANGESFYTRAGNFNISKDGSVVDTNGYTVQGWDLTGTGKGSPTDIILDTSTCQPKHTNKTTVQVNLPTTDSDATQSTTDPYFALLQQWDATQEPPLAASAYAWQTTMTVYDEGGTAHKLSIYFDRVTENVADANSSETYWEYIITMDPAEDVRDFSSAVGDVSTSPDVPDTLKGLLGAGTMTFNSSGQMTDMTCFVPQTDGTASDSWWDASSGTAEVDLSKWVAAPLDTDGQPVIAANFSGTPGLSNAYDPGNYGQPNPNASDRLISIDFGLSSANDTWSFASTTVTSPTGLVTAADLGTSKLNATGFGNQMQRSDTATTCQGKSYQEYNLAQDGYTFGYLSSINIDQNGILSGRYSNGQSLELYQIALYNFPSLQNLRHEGNNLYTETAASGMAVCGVPGTGQFGTTESYKLEQSNVDLTTEFVNLIATQRGFQANSKTITTVDTMLETVIGMKR